MQFGTNSVRLSGLVISQTYEVQVLAVNAKGRGPSSTPATIYVGEAGEMAAVVMVIDASCRKGASGLGSRVGVL